MRNSTTPLSNSLFGKLAGAGSPLATMARVVIAWSLVTMPAVAMNSDISLVTATSEVKQLTQEQQNRVKTVLFVDRTVADYQDLISQVSDESRVVVLDADKNGVLQISETLAAFQKLDSIQILSHGHPGQLSLGSSKLNNTNLDDYQSALQGWGRALVETGDILLYGCNVAQGEAGNNFVHQLSELTGADIAASSDVTGSKTLGANWLLEKHTDQIEASAIIPAEAQQQYRHLLLATAGFQDIPPSTTEPLSISAGEFTLTNESGAPVTADPTAPNTSDGVYYTLISSSDLSLKIMADVASTATFDLTGVSLTRYGNTYDFTFTITGLDASGTPIGGATTTVTSFAVDGVSNTTTPVPDNGSYGGFTGIAGFRIVASTPNPTNHDTITYAGFTIANAAAPGSNSAPTFDVGATTTLILNEDAGATTISGIGVTDTDVGDTLTWSQGSTAPLKGSTSFIGTASASGGAGDLPTTFTYTPTANLNGPDTFTIDVSDGNGGSDTLTVNVTINSIADISADTVPANAVYGFGSNLDFTLAFDEAVTVTGSPRIALDIGGAVKYATYVSGSGTTTLTFRYVVEAGLNDANGIAITNPLDLNTGTIRNSGSRDADLSGVSFAGTTGVLVDTIAPTANFGGATDDVGTITGALSSGDTTDDAALLLSGSNESGSTVSVYDGAVLLGSATVIGTNWSYTATVANGTTYQFNVKESDASGNTSAATSNFSVTGDTVAPTANFSSATDDVGAVTGVLTNGDTTDDTALLLAGTNESGSTVSVYNGAVLLGSATVIGTNWSYTATVANGTSYQFNVKETDTVGNTSAATSNFSVTGDTAAPTANFGSATDDVGTITGALSSGDTTDDAALLLSGSNESGSTVSVYNGALLLGSATVIGTSWSYTATVANGTTYQFNIKESDAAGNTSAATANFTVTGDTVAPTANFTAATDNVGSITGALNSGDSTDDTALVLSGTNATGSTVNVYNGVALLGAANVAGTTWSYSATVANGVTYQFNVKESDAVGNSSAATANFTVTGDTVAPTANFTAATDNVGSITGALNSGDSTDDTALVLSGTNASGSTVNVYNGVALLGAANVAGTTWSYTATITNGVTYQFNVKESDAAGNTSAATANFAVTGDTVAPTANFGAATDNVGSVTGALNSGDSTDDTALVLSGTNASGSTVNVYNGVALLGAANVAGTTWSYSATVANGTTYQFNVKESDAAGNTSTATANFIVTGDTAAPTANFGAATDNVGPITGALNSGDSTDDTALVLSGTNASGSTVNVYNGVALLGAANVAGTTWSYTATITNGVTYQFNVKESDAAGNTSAATTNFTVTGDTVSATPSTPDMTTATDTGASNTDNQTGDSTPIFTGTAETGSTVTLRSSVENVIGSVVASGGNWSITSSTLSLGAHNISATATDTVGNTSSASSSLAVIILSDLDGDGDPDITDPDIDGDGMSNAYEDANGLNKLDANDRDTDLDGDGVSNFDEFAANSSANADDYPPVVTPPADITVDATGLFTAVDVGTGSANDVLDGAITATSNASIHYAPGVHLVTWSATDAAGNTATATQSVNVNPMVGLSKSQVTAEGGTASFSVILNGDFVNSVSVPYTVSGTALTDGSDHDLVDGTAIINSGTSTSININIVDDGAGEGTETIVITLGTPINAAIGSASTHTVEIIEGNVAPTVNLSADQGAGNTLTVTQTDGLVSVSSVVTDPNALDSHSYDWSLTDNALSDTDGVADTFSFDPLNVIPGFYTLRLNVNDGTASSAAELTLKVLATAPVLTTADSDGDGTDDQSEGYGDSDGDGIADYLDAIVSGNVLQITNAGSNSYLIEAEAGLVLRLGDVAFQTGNAQAEIIMSDITNAGGNSDAAGHNYDSGLFDIVVEGGKVITVVIPQRAAIPANAIYRNLTAAGWSTFVEDTENLIYSAAGEAGYCPPPGDAAYQPGLTEGNLCVQLTIVDGGANDADGVVNNRVANLGGVTKSLVESGVTKPLVEERNDDDFVSRLQDAIGSADPWWLLMMFSLLPLRRRSMV